MFNGKMSKTLIRNLSLFIRTPTPRTKKVKYVKKRFNLTLLKNIEFTTHYMNLHKDLFGDEM
jgi:hypothetical protein